MVLKKVQKNSLVDNIVNQIEEAILIGLYKPGEKLPSIQDLQKLLGASHGTLREALRALQQKNLIEVRLGVKGGAYVKDPGTESVTESLALLIRQRKVSLKDLAEFREVVEAGLLRLVSERSTADEVKGLRRFLLELQKHSSKGAEGWRGFLDVEVRLRKTLIRMSRNRMYEAVLFPIHDNIFSYFDKDLPFEEADIKRAYNEWREVINAIGNRDGEKAASVMHEHIDFYANLMIKLNSQRAET